MKDFNCYAPTEVVFGEQSEEQVAALVKKYGGTKVLVNYGGQSAVKSGLLDKICMAKYIDYGVPYEGNVWDFYFGKATPTRML